jgi:hypothetical protein
MHEDPSRLECEVFVTRRDVNESGLTEGVPKRALVGSRLVITRVVRGNEIG